ncbi:hypothetical protein, partial [Catenulispora rubra]|uniref:hypothetical protein n=1 Tax=Catenulispora rubra TaxID=280293 RepID=UPI001E47EDEF
MGFCGSGREIESGRGIEIGREIEIVGWIIEDFISVAALRGAPGPSTGTSSVFRIARRGGGTAARKSEVVSTRRRAGGVEEGVAGRRARRGRGCDMAIARKRNLRSTGVGVG